MDRKDKLLFGVRDHGPITANALCRKLFGRTASGVDYKILEQLVENRELDVIGAGWKTYLIPIESAGPNPQ